MQSKKYSLNTRDVIKVLDNAALFFAPAALLFLIQIQSGKSIKEALYIIYLWGLNTLVDLIKKYLAGDAKKRRRTKT